MANFGTNVMVNQIAVNQKMNTNQILRSIANMKLRNTLRFRSGALLFSPRRTCSETSSVSPSTFLDLTDVTLAGENTFLDKV